MQIHLTTLKEMAAHESFEVKKNFPSNLRPILKAAGEAAIQENVLDSNFYGHVTSILPYNMFTMKVIYYYEFLFIFDRNLLQI